MAEAGVAGSNETVNTNAKSNEPIKILCAFIFCNPFEQMFFQTLHWLDTSAGLPTFAWEEVEASRHVPVSEPDGSNRLYFPNTCR